VGFILALACLDDTFGAVGVGGDKSDERFGVVGFGFEN
jgi:hypothetical protein